jgi:hypothetical protein
MTKRIQLRRDTTANWESVDPVLAAGEVGVDLTTGQIKIGDGESSWTELVYYSGNGSSIDNDPTQLSFEAGDDEDLVSHSAGFVEGAPVFQIRLNTHLSGEEQTIWGFDVDGTTEFPDAIKLRWAGDKSLAGTIGTGPGGFSLVGEPGKEFAIVLSDTEENSSFWSFGTDGTLNLPNDGELVFNRSGTEAGKIIPSTSTGGGLQVEAQSDFEIKVTQGEGEEVETAIWSFEAGGDLVFPDGSIQTTAYTGEGNSGGSSTTELAYLELTNNAFGEPVEFNNTGEDGGVDEISEGLHITRGNVGWLYNPLEESESGENTPTNSLWNNDGWDDLTDIEDRDYVSLSSIWGNNFRNIVGAEMVMLDTTTDKYYAVKITRWSRDGEGFSYVRYEIDVDQLPEGIKFADGTLQKTAYVATNVKLTAPGDRRIEEVSGYKSVSVTERSTSDYTGASSRTTSTSYEIFVKRTTELDAILLPLRDGDANYSVEISFDNVNFLPTNLVSVPETEYWFADFNNNEYIPQTEDDPVYIRITTGADPVIWWDKNELPGGGSNFRGAIIDFHAYTGDSTIIGTIHIVDDDGEEHITHTEVQSGSSDGENDDLWVVNNEGQIQYRRIDQEEKTLKIQWSAKVFYGSELYD